MWISKKQFLKGTFTSERWRYFLVSGKDQIRIAAWGLIEWIYRGDTVTGERVMRGGIPYFRCSQIVRRGQEPLFIEYVSGRKWAKWSLLEGYGTGHIPIDGLPKEVPTGTVLEVRISDDSCHIIRTVGTRDEPGFEETLLLAERHIETVFREKVQEEAKKLQGTIKKSISEKPWKSPFWDTFQSLASANYQEVKTSTSGNHLRLDLRKIPIFTIDGADAKDLDDAISLEKVNTGAFLLGVHIADVSEYVTPDTELDREARRRGTSIYLPSRVIPMLPEILSNELCSLHPGEPKLTLSLFLEIDGHGGVTKTYLTESIIESHRKGVYEEIEREHLSGAHTEMYELYEILKQRRRNEGKLLFETRESKFQFSETGEVIAIRPRERQASHELIEEFMVIANEEVAKWCRKYGIPFLSRIHEPPPMEQSSDLRKIYTWPTGTEITPKKIRDALEEKHGEELYRYQRLTLPRMSKAYYGPKTHGHFGLALDEYTHFTSPIRRYPDLLTHRAIKWFLRKNEKEARIPIDELVRVGTLSSEKESSATDLERTATSLLLARYYESRIGEKCQGRLSGMTDWGYFIELPSGAEVMVPRESTPSSRIDPLLGIESRGTKTLHIIGECLDIEITGVDRLRWRVIGTFLWHDAGISHENDAQKQSHKKPRRPKRERR